MSIDRLLEIMKRLRDPEQGCPWDRQQDFASISPYTIEEAYEVAETIAAGDMAQLHQELGDLLFQVVFYSQMARELDLFDFNDVVEAICAKMLRRHPHVFGDAEIDSAEQQHHAWERMKRDERRDRTQHGVLDDVAHALPALLRAQKLQKRAARVGFDWADGDGVLDKLAEELDELRRADCQADREEELGDLLFSCVNLARHLGIDAEEALRRSNRKFERRFRSMETELSDQGRKLSQLTEAEWDDAWIRAKRRIKASEGGTSGATEVSDPA